MKAAYLCFGGSVVVQGWISVWEGFINSVQRAAIKHNTGRGCDYKATDFGSLTCADDIAGAIDVHSLHQSLGGGSVLCSGGRCCHMKHHVLTSACFTDGLRGSEISRDELRAWNSWGRRHDVENPDIIVTCVQ